MEYVDYEYLTASRAISNRECLLYGLVFSSTTSVGRVEVHDGDSTTDPLFGKFDGEANKTVVILFPAPVRLQRGLYIEINANVGSVTVLWRPLPT